MVRGLLAFPSLEPKCKGASHENQTNLLDCSRRHIVATLQTALNRKGYGAGAADGTLGPITQKALSAYQKATGLPESGYADRKTLAALHQRAGPFGGMIAVKAQFTLMWSLIFA